MNGRCRIYAVALVLTASAFVISFSGGLASAEDAVAVEPTFETQPHEPIVIYDESYLEVGSNGISSGTGTADDPFVIEGWEISIQDPVGGGISIFGTTSHVLIRNVYVHSCYYGIWLQGTSNVAIVESVVTDCVSGIVIWTSADASVVSNIVANNGELGGVSIDDSVRVKFSSNQLIDDGLRIGGWTEESYVSQIITPDNTVNGKPLLYYCGVDGVRVSAANIGELIIYDSTNVQITGLDLEDTDVGISLAFVNKVLVRDCTFLRTTMYGLNLEYSSDAVIVGNVFGESFFAGLSLWECDGVVVAGNSFSDDFYGMGVWNSDRVVIAGNQFVSEGIEIFLEDSTNLVIRGNTFRD